MPKISKQRNHKNPTRISKSNRRAGAVGRIGPIGFDPDEGIKINLYGKSGTGKTTLCATFPKPILFLLCSGGKRPGELRSIDTPEYRSVIKCVTIQQADDIRELVDYQWDRNEFATFVLDHGTGLQDQVLKEELDLDELPPQSSWGIASRETWGRVALKTKEYLRALLNLTCNVVIVAQERNFSEEGEGSDLLMPTIASALSPSVTGWLNPACDYVCQTFIRGKMKEVETKIGKGDKAKTVTTRKRQKGVEYCLRTAPHEIYMTKFRLPKGTPLPEVIVDPTYEKIMRLIRGKEVQ